MCGRGESGMERGLWTVGRVKLDMTFNRLREGKQQENETETDANSDEFDPTLGFCIRLCVVQLICLCLLFLVFESHFHFLCLI